MKIIMKYNENNPLLGSWVSTPDEIKSKGEAVRLDFSEDGQLIYTSLGETKDQIILLTYRIDKGLLITDQPSHPREEKTSFSITANGELILDYAGEITKFMRYQDFCTLTLSKHY
jgi:hypothetical protein